MKAKDKAVQLINKIYDELLFHDDWERAKKCGLIAVDELIKQEISLLGLSDKYIPTWWNMVKNEIEKL